MKYEWHLYSSAAHYGVQPIFHLNNKLPSEGFTSLYAVTQETAEAIVSEGTTRQFKGVVWSPHLWLDFDKADAAERAGSRLEEMGLGFDAYTTGNRGLHFRLDRSVNTHPSHLLPAKDKQWVRKHFPDADASIYTHLHPFRLEGTRHEKSGNRKERIHHHVGNPIEVPALEEQAFATVQHQGNGKSIFDNFKLMANTVPIHNGNRQYFLIRQLYALRESGVPADIALWWTSEWNKMLSEPKEEHEIEKAVRSIYGG